ncbi:MAG: hypothetical protein GIW99_00590 [Candidatus Eremiobacteraeota bacterium]|nr:hypothetical protein [Candidatus Eremiobacteraeota bacterium]
MTKFIARAAIAAGISLSLALVGCSGANNIVSGSTGAKGFARLIDASPLTTTPLGLQASSTTINSNITSSTPIGPYATVGAGNQQFSVPGLTINNNPFKHSISSATNYTVVVEGEPGATNYQTFIFQDTNPSASPASVRFKVDNAAPNLTTAVDVYVHATANPALGIPTIAGLALNNDSGSYPGAPGNSYLPPQPVTTLNTYPTSTYALDIVPAGTTPTGTSADLFFGTTTTLLTAGVSYSFVIYDKSATANSIGVLLAQDSPQVQSNQSGTFSAVVHKI